MAKAKNLWIQKALGASKADRAKRKGALHRQLGIPENEVIPMKILLLAAKAPGLLGQRARLALTLRRMPHKRAGRY
jgi:hypothetical protein